MHAKKYVPILFSRKIQELGYFLYEKVKNYLFCKLNSRKYFGVGLIFKIITLRIKNLPNFDSLPILK